MKNPRRRSARSSEPVTRLAHVRTRPTLKTARHAILSLVDVDQLDELQDRIARRSFLLSYVLAGQEPKRTDDEALEGMPVVLRDSLLDLAREIEDTADAISTIIDRASAKASL